ncbi:hypothetical protein K450DRAFT_223759 [Umbelopsis ramanniana AG]|uniref:Zn(2)-C6 fungal-type domain-containing protein n=1 Tax=Umbelopsis ramanniana AG TaxID=1314678 RepID=A0AAD5HGG7_UMBRA|nr:uncharacterized protein K450DRAFT_223759 [Umbelopsis ramanniana AG]KAI8583455.1 hypothetical protein K450DRAFT_223759 [Umbelopsis ramanniana AG]
MVGTDSEYSPNGSRRKRTTPCTECKFHRRKCIRIDDNAKCERCVRLKRQCVNVSRKPESEEDNSIDDEIVSDETTTHTIINYYQQLNELQEQFHSLEKALTMARITPELSYSASDFDSSSSGSTSNESISLLPPLSPDGKADPNEQQVVRSKRQKTLDGSNKQSWTLSMTKNGLSVHTNIQSVQDLMSFGMYAVQYLDGISINPPPSDGLSTLSLIARGRVNNISHIFHQALKKNAGHGAVSVPSVSASLIFDQENVISILLTAYFACFNDSHSIMTRSLYYSRFHNPEDPLSSPLTAVMCAVMTMRPCRHIPYSFQELRQMGEYFFNIARDGLADIIHEPSQSTEGTIGFLLLAHYCFYTLRFSEARSYSTTAYLIAHNAVGHIKEINSTSAEMVIMKRVYFMLSLQESSLKNFLGGQSDNFDVEIFNTKLEALPDDSDFGRTFIKLGSRILNLLRSQQLLRVLRQLHNAHSGEITEFSADAFIRLQHLIQNWWKDTPLEERVFLNPFEIKVERGDFDKVQHSHQFMALLAFHAFQISVHSCFISGENDYLDQEKQSTCSEQANAIYYQSMRVCLNSSKMLLDISEKIYQLDDICRFDYGFLMGILEALAVLTASNDQFIAKEASIYVKKCFTLVRMTMFQDMTSVPDKLVVGQKPDKHLVTLPLYDSCPSPALYIMWESMVRSLSELGIHIE